MIRSLVKEYGVPWVFNRSLYSIKLKTMRTIPVIEKMFEKEVYVKRVDIFKINTCPIEELLGSLSAIKKEEILLIADNAIQGKIKGFSSIDLDYGYPIEWNVNPITSKEVDNSLKWYQIPDFNPVLGDIKAVWEISRFTHFFYIVRAYMISKDRKYYLAFSNQLDEWLKENMYSYGANYKCGQEATLRMINILIAYSVFKSYGLTTLQDSENVRRIVESSYKKVLSNFFYAHKCIKNNHTLSEIVGLIVGAWACNDDIRLKKAYELLNKEIIKQFLPDGGYIQYSFNYQRFALQLMEFVLSISNQTNIQITNKSKELIKNSANLLYQLQDEAGDVPNYGSNDGALIFPVTSCDYRNFKPVINTISALIDGERIYENGIYDEEFMWFGNEDINNLKHSCIDRKSTSFNDSGYYSFRHKDGFLMTTLQNYKTRPAQMDQLHIDLWHKGINVFCDSGTYSYATDIGKGMALTAAHNTAKLDDKEQMKKREPFLIYDWTSSKNISHSKSSFTGTMISKNGYQHTRDIQKATSGYTVIDKVSGDGKFCEIYFHTPLRVRKDSGGVRLYKDEELICSLLTENIVEIRKSYRSLHYLKKEEISCIIIKNEMKENKCSNELLIKMEY
ncbi:hypothetical protein SporoP8_12180 [Sporosarcina ureae]|uniref:heparinase II/III domain-containing protein n=1 Tax=Sporosarcina ureae TaxID=1571 RepID=UPI000A14C419|nr:heparinase II/III family protein [Sporosarcina ureae]ARJ39565.1 hypothetical protein SporoP8_12180 [Sporosarcina ureae]